MNETETDPLDPDTDDGGIDDGTEVLDQGTDPHDPLDDRIDSDGDGLVDPVERDLGTDPFDVDTDGDGLLDGDEINVVGTDPLEPDTDGGGVDDGAEVDRNSDPLDAADDFPDTGRRITGGRWFGCASAPSASPPPASGWLAAFGLGLLGLRRRR